jgi:hypothetical protein
MYDNLTLAQFIATAGMHFVLSAMLARACYIVARDTIRALYRLTAPPGPRIVYMREKQRRMASK